MLILGIETSCDETAIAILEINSKISADELIGGSINVRANIVSSQVKLHAPYGGVVPHLAARAHEKNLPLVLARALRAAKVKIEKIDRIAVTAGPGLAPALWRGVNFANALAEKYQIPIVGTNHLRGHVYSNWLSPIKGQTADFKNISFPIFHLIVSGGHTLLALMTGQEKFKLIGETQDDAAGEAFDKVARLFGLDYPGGPAIAQAAKQFSPANGSLGFILPRPMLHSKDYNFSFAGLKTAVLYLVRDMTAAGWPLTDIRNEIAHEFQQAVIDVLLAKTLKAAKQYKARTVALSGGVSANRELRKQLAVACQKSNINCLVAPLTYTGDNAAMIALAGYFQAANKKPNKPVAADANWELC